MREWGFWDWCGFTVLWIAVAGSAIDQALKLMPELASRIEPASARSRAWLRSTLAFAPLGLLLFATVILAARAIGLIGLSLPDPPAAAAHDKYWWPPLNASEVLDLRSALRSFPKPESTLIYCGNSNCRELSDSIYALLSGLDWNDLRRMSMDPGVNGIVLQESTDDNSLADAIERATKGRLQVNFVKVDGLRFARLMIGSKPN